LYERVLIVEMILPSNAITLIQSKFSSCHPLETFSSCTVELIKHVSTLFSLSLVPSCRTLKQDVATTRDGRTRRSPTLANVIRRLLIKFTEAAAKRPSFAAADTFFFTDLARLSHRNSVCLSVTRVDQSKTVITKSLPSAA